MEKLAQANTIRSLKVVVLGAECTGKTSLIEALAEDTRLHDYELQVIPELLRDFCVRHSRTPRRDEQTDLLDAQCAALLNNQTGKKLPINIADCGPITTALYSQMYFQDQSLLARATQFHSEQIDLHLVLKPEFSWTADPLPFMRDGQAAQNRFDQLLSEWLNNNPQLPRVRLSGGLTERIATASAAILAAYARGPE
jgi:nicotinamide riboside kinase